MTHNPRRRHWDARCPALLRRPAAPPFPQRKSRFCKFAAEPRADQPDAKGILKGKYCRLHLVEEPDQKDAAGRCRSAIFGTVHGRLAL